MLQAIKERIRERPFPSADCGCLICRVTRLWRLTSAPENVASPQVGSGEWMDALAKNIVREEGHLQRAYNEVLTQRMLGDAPNEITGFERAIETSLMALCRIRMAVERTLKSASIGDLSDGARKN